MADFHKLVVKDVYKETKDTVAVTFDVPESLQSDFQFTQGQYLTLKKYKKALVAFDFAIISDDTFVGAYLERGKVLEKLKRYEEAIENYTITLELDDPTAYAYVRIGECYQQLGETETSISFLLFLSASKTVQIALSILTRKAKEQNFYKSLMQSTDKK